LVLKTNGLYNYKIPTKWYCKTLLTSILLMKNKLLKMKNKTKVAWALCLLMVVAIINTGFRKYEKVITANEVMKSLLFGISTSTEYALERGTGWPDSTLIRKVQEDGEQITMGALSQCYTSPADMYNEAMGSLYTPEIKNSTPVKNFKTAFGADLFKPALKLAAYEMGTNKKATMNMFNAIALKQAFDKMYLKPTESVDGFALQKLYDISMKAYLQDCCNVIADVMNKKALFLKLAANYKLNATTKKYFNGVNESFAASDKLLADKEYQCIDNRHSRIVGMLLRRQIDGSLPTALNCLKTIVNDYDPSFYSQISSKF
jgi:hypothetical protein